MQKRDKNTQIYRANVYFDLQLHRIAKAKAAMTGKSLSEYLEDLVRKDNSDYVKEPRQEE